ncbi:MAG TPA: serine acetyltransferase [Usitatibacter sp.]|nr:serine acetyltransferase [Usitatibacter sp.]
MDPIFGALRADVRRTYDLLEGGRLRRLVHCARSPGVQAVAVYRLGQWLSRRPAVVRLFLEPFFAIGQFVVRVLWGIELPRSARIGPGLYIGHFGGIIVSPDAVIGSHCSLSPSITIGLAGQGERLGVPVIGDFVYVAPGARLFGKIRIGNNVKIGANAVVHRDVPDNAVVALDPGFRIISFSGNVPRSAKTDIAA